MMKTWKKVAALTLAILCGSQTIPASVFATGNMISAADAFDQDVIVKEEAAPTKASNDSEIISSDADSVIQNSDAEILEQGNSSSNQSSSDAIISSDSYSQFITADGLTMSATSSELASDDKIKSNAITGTELEMALQQLRRVRSDTAAVDARYVFSLTAESKNGKEINSNAAVTLSIPIRSDKICTIYMLNNDLDSISTVGGSEENGNYTISVALPVTLAVEYSHAVSRAESENAKYDNEANTHTIVSEPSADGASTHEDVVALYPAINFGTLSFQDGSSIKVIAPEGAFQEGTKLKVTRGKVTNELVSSVSEKLQDDNIVADNIAVYDFDFYRTNENGNEVHNIEPKKDISVTFNDVSVSGSTKGDEISVYHMDEGTDSLAKAEVKKSSTNGVKTANATIEANAFSSYVLVRQLASSAPTAQGVYIKSLSSKCFYGGTYDDATGSYLWSVPTTNAGYQSGHRFAFRISFSLSGQYSAPAGSITIALPKTILKDRTGVQGDSYEMSVPSKQDVADAKNRGEALEENIKFAYYEDGDNIILYNIKEVPAGEDDYIEMSYYTTETSFAYTDMTKSAPFTAHMKINSTAAETTEQTTAPLFAGINTTAQVKSVEKRKPTKYTKWQNDWGTDAKPANDGDYVYLVWTIATDVSATQPYTLTYKDVLKSFYGESEAKASQATESNSMTVLGVRFSGENGFTAAIGDTPITGSVSISNQQNTNIRYDYVLTAIPYSEGSVFKAAQYMKAFNTITATVTPEDKLDEKTEQSGSNDWTWTKRTFKQTQGFCNIFKRGDAAYRTLTPNNQPLYGGTNHFANSMGMTAGEYSRYDLEKFNGYQADGTIGEKELTSYSGFDYAAWACGFLYPYTASHYGSDVEDPNTYGFGTVPVVSVLTDEGVYLTTDQTLNDNSAKGIPLTQGTKLTSKDFYFDSIAFSWFLNDAQIDTDLNALVSSKADYSNGGGTLVFEGKFGDSDRWTQFGTYTIKTARTGTANFDNNYVKSVVSNVITFADGVNCTAYRISTSNTRYYTELFARPDITLKNSDTVMDLISGQTVIDIINNDQGDWYFFGGDVNANGSCEDEIEAWKTADWRTISDTDARHIARTYDHDIDYARTSEKYSDVVKKVNSATNDTKKRRYTIEWEVRASESYESGNDGIHQSIKQESGIFYDLLPEGATINLNSIQIYDTGYTKPARNELKQPLGTTQKEKLASYGDANVEVETKENYKNSGRTLLIVRINKAAGAYTLAYDTYHSWDSIADYGNDVYNPVAYETGNSSIYGGFADNGGLVKADGSKNNDAIQDAALMSGLDDAVADEYTSQEPRKFLYSEAKYDIVAITAASTGLTKKVKASSDSEYSYGTQTTIDGVYSYQLRFMNGTENTAKELIFYDSLENYSATDTEEAKAVGNSDWHGTLQGIDTAQLVKAGIAPVVYISTIKNLSINAATSQLDAIQDGNPVWIKVDENTDLFAATAVAIDMRKKADGADFSLVPSSDKGSGKISSVSAVLYMAAPDSVPSLGKIPYTYNNVFMHNKIFGKGDTTGTEFLIHQDYTKVKLRVTGDLSVHKTSAQSSEIPCAGITYRLTGTTAYGTTVDKTVVTNDEGKVRFNDLEQGSYMLQEYKATDDWLLDTTEHKVTVDAKGHTIVDGVDLTSIQNRRKITSDLELADVPRIHADFSFYKRSHEEYLDTDTGKITTRSENTVEGAKFRLSGTSDYGNDLLMYSTSSATGEVLFENVEKGSYKLEEIEAPSNYALSPVIFAVDVSETGQASIVGYYGDDGSIIEDKEKKYYELGQSHIQYVYNSYRYFKFFIRKYDSATDIGLNGAHFALIGTSDLGTDINMDVETVSKSFGSTAIDGVAEFENVEAGTYLLKEITAPTGTTSDGTGTTYYSLDPSTYKVVITDLGNIKITNANTGTALAASSVIPYAATYTYAFEFPNTKAKEGRITITKIWDDASNNDARPIPKIHLTMKDLDADK